MAFAPLSSPNSLIAPSESFAHFTNREKEQDALARVFRISEPFALPLLHFYGIGGAGKTWLLRRLVENARIQSIPAAYVNLEELPNNLTGGVNALMMIRNQLTEFELPGFDLALAWYLTKTGFGKEKPTKRGAKPSGLGHVDV